MTRLTSSDVAGLDLRWAEYDARLRRVLGVDLLGLAAAAAGREAAQVGAALRGRRLAAVSVSSGAGIVGGFAASLAAIGRHLGLEGRAMGAPDSEGFEEAARWGADYVIYADDESFIVRDLAGQRAADNNPATSRVFATALEFMSGGLAGRDVLVLGLGIIGRGAAARLTDLGARPLMYDIDPARRELAARTPGGEIIGGPAELRRAAGRTRLIFDATPVSPALDEELWPEAPMVAAPGVPLAWPVRWMDENKVGRLWHDPLQSGTAAMLAMVSAE